VSLRLSLLEWHLPVAIRRRMLDRLVRMSADAFGVPPPVMPDIRDSAFVGAYARFTRGEVERVGAHGAAAVAVRTRLYNGGRGMGCDIRRRAGVRTPVEAMRALRVIYRAIGIEIDTDLAAGEVTVRRCAFSGVYTPEVCDFVSALDAGIVHGISGNLTVVFTHRMTEGAPTCRARLTVVTAP
jgi:hypothetical protein